MCVQDVDARCVLQFTLIHAAGCALHRRTSRVIHRLELCLHTLAHVFAQRTRSRQQFDRRSELVLTYQLLTVRSVRHRAREALGDERVEAAAEETVTAPSQTGDGVSRFWTARLRAKSAHRDSLNLACEQAKEAHTPSPCPAAPPSALRRRSAARYLDGSLTTAALRVCVSRRCYSSSSVRRPEAGRQSIQTSDLTGDRSHSSRTDPTTRTDFVESGVRHVRSFAPTP